MSFFKNLFGKKQTIQPESLAEGGSDPTAGAGSGAGGGKVIMQDIHFAPPGEGGPTDLQGTDPATSQEAPTVGDAAETGDLQGQIDTEEISFVFEKIKVTYNPENEPQNPTDTLDLNFQKVTPADAPGTGDVRGAKADAPGYVSDAEGGGEPAQYEGWPAKWYVPELDNDKVDPSNPTADGLSAGGSPEAALEDALIVQFTNSPSGGDMPDESGEVGGTEGINFMKESQEPAAVAESFGFGVELEMKESGEKSGTEDINIGVGELQGSTAPEPDDAKYFVADSFSFGVEREMKESGEKGGTEDTTPAGLDFIKESQEPSAVADTFSFGVEREMKESGEKGGTEDINIGVGELQEASIAKSMDSGPEPESPGALQGIIDDGDASAKGGKVEFEWKVEEGESAPPPGQQATLTAAVQPVGGPAPGGDAVPAAQNTGPSTPGEEEGIIIVNSEPGEADAGEQVYLKVELENTQDTPPQGLAADSGPAGGAPAPALTEDGGSGETDDGSVDAADYVVWRKTDSVDNSQPGPGAPDEGAGIIIANSAPGESQAIIDDGKAEGIIDDGDAEGAASPSSPGVRGGVSVASGDVNTSTEPEDLAAEEPEAEGGPATSQVLTLQGDRLDPATAPADDDGPAVLFEQKVMEGGAMTKLGEAGLGGPDTSELDGGVEHEDDWETPEV